MAMDNPFEKKESPSVPDKRKYACTVVSMLPFQLNEEKPHMLPAVFKVPAAVGEDYGILHVEEGIHYIPNPLIDEGKPGASIKQTTLADEMARSIVEDYATAQIALSEGAGPGIFWVPGRLTIKQVRANYPNFIEENEARQKKWFHNLCALASADWQKNHNMLAVSDLQRMAARALGIQEQWVDFDVSETVKCSMCQTPVNPLAVVCASCKHILKPELYRKEQFANV